ncbi:SEC14-like protein 2 [Folsomia candida]|uniref:SEC14-like protein 2 n=1 Tax=Folsomia candida TaxID=158441 RepID=UPI000B8EFDFD|nr:SEC14-like protein 2 [Folsomia candida]
MEKPSLCPSLAEIDLMKEFRKKIQDLNLSEVELEDKVLVRWLRARNNNLKDAEQMLRKHVEWKVEMDVENIFENGIPPGWDEELPWVLAGFTPSGSAVCISDSVKWDFQRFTTTEQRKKDFARYAILTLEEKWGTALLMGKSRPYVPQLISIYDLKGLSWRQLSSPHAIEVGLNLTRMAEANYPEIVQTLILVNVPRIFQIVWRLLSPFVTDRTKAKIMFLGWDKAEWTREISRHIPLDQFPKEYGGLGDDDVNLRLQYREEVKAMRK